MAALSLTQELKGWELRTVDATFPMSEGIGITLWLCQNSYWKWPFIVDFPIKNGDFPCYVSLPEGIRDYWAKAGEVENRWNMLGKW